MGVEPTGDRKTCRPPVLKTGRITGPHALPYSIYQLTDGYQRFTAYLLHVCYSMDMRHQRGYVYHASGSFFVRYYDSGQQVSHRLCSKDDKFILARARAVKMLADEFMQTVNAGKIGNVQDITVADFWKQTYQPFTVENLRHSTVYGYRHVWAQHLEKHFGTITLREYRTHMGSAFLTKLAKTLCRSTVKHIRFLASGIFSHAGQSWVSSKSNPGTMSKCWASSRAPGDTTALHLGRGREYHLSSGRSRGLSSHRGLSVFHGATSRRNSRATMERYRRGLDSHPPVNSAAGKKVG